MKRLRSEMFSGGGISLMAAVFSGSGETPELSIIWPRKVIVRLENKHFSLFNIRLADCIRLSVVSSLLSCSSWDFPNTRV